MSKVVIVDYFTEAVFKVPKHIDLEDKSVVKEWYVKWAVLHIHFVDKEKEPMEIEYCREPELDTKWGTNERINDADDWGYGDDEEDINIIDDIIKKIVANAQP